MFEKLFTKPNLHALAVCVIVGAATSLQSLIAAGTWTWHALLFGLIGGVLSAAAGWLIRQLNGAPPANGTAAMVAFLLLLLPLASCSPTSLSGDSSKLGPISMMVRIDGGDLPTWGPSQHATKTVGQSWKQCVFWRFGSGHVLAVGDTTGCGAIAAAQFRPDRVMGYTPAELDWQSGACLQWSGCVSGLGLGPRFRVPRDVLLTHRA